MDITKDIKYLGVNDHEVDLFESQYKVPNGLSYNSYLIDGGDKTLVMDAVDSHFISEWLDNVASELNGRTPDYLMVQHMEPDHSAGIFAFMEKYPEAVVVSSAKAFQMMKNYFGTDWSERRVVVKEGDTLEVGTHTLTFVAAPMVHWPEVMVTYDINETIDKAYNVNRDSNIVVNIFNSLKSMAGYKTNINVSINCDEDKLEKKLNDISKDINVEVKNATLEVKNDEVEVVKEEANQSK